MRGEGVQKSVETVLRKLREQKKKTRETSARTVGIQANKQNGNFAKKEHEILEDKPVTFHVYMTRTCKCDGD
jgi:hypothetical protein